MLEWSLIDDLGPAIAIAAQGNGKATFKSRLGFVCQETLLYRRCTKLMDQLADAFIVEIGCSFGKGTQTLMKKIGDPQKLLALDTSELCLTSCRERCPDIRCIKLDIIVDWKVFEHEVAQLVGDNDQASLVFFCDIGGDRDLESVVSVIKFIETTFKPVLFVVKSEELHRVAEETGIDSNGWAKILQTSKACATDRLKTERPHPKDAPLRTNADGVAICRFHNYDMLKGCLRHRDTKKFGTCCEFDHIHCHLCRRPGHRAGECEFEDRDRSLLELLAISK
mmetsp:Transcript_20650/g.34066  ORF Transcript_20650/g.34066 Transcript_20650/m.34066 type:complete len:280 (-) Transcript_20650:879-1718(-)